MGAARRTGSVSGVYFGGSGAVADELGEGYKRRDRFKRN